MLAYDTPVEPSGYGWSPNDLTHGTVNVPSCHSINNNHSTSQLSQCQTNLPRASTVAQVSSINQTWPKSHLYSPPSSINSSSSTARPGQSEYATLRSRRLASDHMPLSLSPFRSVKRMKRPFELKLPASPKSPNTMEEKEPRASPRSRGLRSWRSDHNLKATDLDALGILPSPPLSDSRVSKTSPKSPCSPIDGRLVFTDDSEMTDAYSRTQADKPHDYPLDPTPEATNVPMAHSSFVNQQTNEYHALPAPTDTEYMRSATATRLTAHERGPRHSYTREPRTRAGTATSDASWLPSSLSYCETWLQGVPAEAMDTRDHASRDEFANRRKFQIVQQSPSPSVESFDGMSSDEPVRFAFASKAKPKLVDISPKPQSASDSGRSPRLDHERLVPSTPAQRQREVSAFSPDTPSERVDSGYATRQSFSSMDWDGFDEDDFTECSSIDSKSATSTVIGQESSNDYDSPPLQDEETLQPMPTPPQSPHSPLTGSNLSEKEEWDIEWTLDNLRESVTHYWTKLNLTSPVIIHIRRGEEEPILRPFRKIFPRVSDNLLSIFCASLIAHNYVVSICSSGGTTPSDYHPSLFGLNRVPPKASALLGFNDIHNQPGPPPKRYTDKILNDSSQLWKEFDDLVDQLLSQICGRTGDEAMKSAALVLILTLQTNVGQRPGLSPSFSQL